MEDLDLDLTKLTEGALRVVTRAEDEARRRGQACSPANTCSSRSRRSNGRSTRASCATSSSTPTTCSAPRQPALDVGAGRHRPCAPRHRAHAGAAPPRPPAGRGRGPRAGRIATTCSRAILEERQSGPSLILRRFGTDGDAVIDAADHRRPRRRAARREAAQALRAAAVSASSSPST